MKVLLLTADFGGNVPPTIAVADALARRGAQVEVAGLAPGRTALTQVPFPPATAIDAREAGRGLRRARPMARLMLGRSTSEAAVALVAERRPDAVAVDCMTLAPLRGALESGVPVAVLFHTFSTFWTGSFDRGAVAALFRMLGLRPHTLWDRAAARLVLTDAELDPGRDDPASAGFEWTGTTETGVAARGGGGSRPRVLVALSSTDWPGMLPVYRRIVEALGSLPVDAVVTTAGVDLGGELVGRANVEVRGWVAHEQLLPEIDLVIGHGGHSTTMKVLAHGIPLLILPINPTADQRFIGGLIEDAGLGRRLAKSASPARIRETVTEMLGDDAISARAAQLGRRLRAQPAGADVAAGRILAIGG